MKKTNNVNEKHWDRMSVNYSDNWKTKAKQYISQRELQFIKKNLPKKQHLRFLDVGVGHGRIVDFLSKLDYNFIHGIDISDDMLYYCKRKFTSKSIRFIKSDISKSDIPFSNKYDVITSIRSLKYNSNWKEIILKCTTKLNPGGVYIFDMPNKYSINILGHYKIKFYRSSFNEISSFLNNNGLIIIQSTSFSRLPDILYDLSSNHYYVNLLILLERFINYIIGDITFGRILYFAVTKHE
jgi:2-polyprenyl-3-methyl-5-hydroxy-6-metoxy-1,4-benzoquinol methylase